MAAMFPTERSPIPMFPSPVDTAARKPAAQPAAQPVSAAPPAPSYEDLIAAPQRELAAAEKNYGEFQGMQAADEAEREALRMQRGSEALQTYRTALEAPEIREERAQLEEKISKPFVPTRDNFQDMAVMYSLIGVLGFAIGAGGKGNAINAMSAMNGMMEGYRQGREDLYEKEKDAFEANTQALQTKINSLNNKMKEIADLAKVDYEKANLEADMLFAQEGADFLKQYKDKVGLVGTIKMLQEKVKGSEKLFEFMTKERDRYEEKERDRQAKADLERQREEARRERQEDQQAFVSAMNKIKFGQTLTIIEKKALSSGGKDGKTSALLAGRAENIREAFAQATTDLVNVTRLPPNTMLGSLAGLTGQSADGMINGIRNAVARGMTTTEQRTLEQLLAGVEGHLAFALGGGYATSASKARMDQYKAQLARAGDDPIQAVIMLARFKQELNILADNYESKPGATPEMNAAVQKYNAKINAAIPFTVEDVLDAQYGRSAQKPSGGTPKPMPTGKKLEDYAKIHFNGDQEKAKTYLRSQGYQ